MKSGLKAGTINGVANASLVTTSTAMKSGLKVSLNIPFLNVGFMVTTSTAMKSGLKAVALLRQAQ